MHSSNACALRSTIVPFAQVYMLQTGCVGGAVHRTRWRLASTTRVSTYMKTSLTHHVHTTNIGTDEDEEHDAPLIVPRRDGSQMGGGAARF